MMIRPMMFENPARIGMIAAKSRRAKNPRMKTPTPTCSTFTRDAGEVVRGDAVAVPDCTATPLSASVVVSRGVATLCVATRAESAAIPLEPNSLTASGM